MVSMCARIGANFASRGKTKHQIIAMVTVQTSKLTTRTWRLAVSSADLTLLHTQLWLFFNWLLFEEYAEHQVGHQKGEQNVQGLPTDVKQHGFACSEVRQHLAEIGV